LAWIEKLGHDEYDDYGNENHDYGNDEENVVHKS
jgi:hypothetical protein